MNHNGGQIFLNLIFLVAIVALCIAIYNVHNYDQKLLANDGARIAALESMKNDMKELDQHLDGLQKLLAPEAKPRAAQTDDPGNTPTSQEATNQSITQTPPSPDTHPSDTSAVNSDQTSGAEPGTPNLQKQPIAQTVIVGPAYIELSGCRANGFTAICTFLVRNTGSDCYFNFYADGSHVYDDRGFEAKAVDAVFANNKMENTLTFGRMVYARMISNVVTSAEFKFEKIAPEATTIALIEIRMDVNHRQKYDVQIRNVPLVR